MVVSYIKTSLASLQLPKFQPVMKRHACIQRFAFWEMWWKFLLTGRHVHSTIKLNYHNVGCYCPKQFWCVIKHYESELSLLRRIIVEELIRNLAYMPLT